jgi:hypothetical protein
MIRQVRGDGEVSAAIRQLLQVRKISAAEVDRVERDEERDRLARLADEVRLRIEFRRAQSLQRQRPRIWADSIELDPHEPRIAHHLGGALADGVEHIHEWS